MEDVGEGAGPATPQQEKLGMVEGALAEAKLIDWPSAPSARAAPASGSALRAADSARAR